MHMELRDMEDGESLAGVVLGARASEAITQRLER